MGLGAPKRRTKLSTDPNNTAWANSTGSFGHKILSQQGWKPGDFLGAENADHAAHWTAANKSHIRIALREENLGLGAKIGGNTAATFGLSLFSGVLGRLNGKSEGEIAKHQNAINDAELRTYQAQKYGFMNFVRGGLLVGDKIEPNKDRQSLTDSPRMSKKRKLDHHAVGVDIEPLSQSNKILPEEPSEDDAVTSKSKRSRKSKKGSHNEVDQVDGSDGSTVKQSATEECRKKNKKRRKIALDDEAQDTGKTSSANGTEDERSRQKAEKRARKEERRRRKDQKRLKYVGSDSVETTKVEPKPASPTTTPTSLAFGGSRHAARQKYIQQKRMASMSAQAVKEIFMVKGTA